MSYTLTIRCRCAVYVSCDPRTRVAHTRIVERRGPGCRTRRHEVGVRVWLWELLPDPSFDAHPVLADDEEPLVTS